MLEKLLVLLIGSNLGDRFGNLEQAIVLIRERIGAIDSESSIYETAPWGYDSEHAFLNQCLTVRTNMDTIEVLQKIHVIESDMGRKKRFMSYTDRIIDIDILLYGDMVLLTADLQIPHKKLHERKFSLVPLAEILPDLLHPVLNKTIILLLTECKDALQVHRVGPD